MADGAMTKREERAFARRVWGVGEREWGDWRWQLANRVWTAEGVRRAVGDLSEREQKGLRAREKWRMPLCLTPYGLSLVAREPPDGAVRRMLLPDAREGRKRKDEWADSLGEEAHAVAPGLVRAYPHKALLLATADCACACRYCTRARTSGAFGRAPGGWEAAVEWLRGCPDIHDVLVSGGDPLTMDDGRLDALLGALKGVPHVDFVRIGTKTPASLPQRATRGLVRVLRKWRPVWLSTHFSHPAELTERAEEACRRLADAGIPLMNQCPLLRGVNDGNGVLEALCERLLRVGVKPYYLHSADRVSGTGHFRVAKARGLEIVSAMHGRTTGYAVPLFMEDAPGGGRKRPVKG
ncbi:MAG: KamA family radical SAM protein [Kiritimatiellae bacterium]|nr:KamA family radical SAM protein [Kiritimatiellia bacterium]